MSVLNLKAHLSGVYLRASLEFIRGGDELSFWPQCFLIWSVVFSLFLLEEERMPVIAL